MPGKKAPPKTAVKKTETKKVLSHSARLKTDKTTKAYFLQIFPKFTEEEWNKIVKEHKNKKHSVAIVHNGFKLTFDPTRISDDPKTGWTYERYLKSYEVIEKSMPHHRRSLKKSHAKAYKKSQPYDPYRRRDIETLEIKTLDYPKAPEKLAQRQNELKNLKRGDEFFICAHGNPKLLGVGPFTMEADEIAANIEHLGIDKKEPPVIVLFACESAKLKFKKRLTDDVRDHLIGAKYESPIVMGTLELLVHSHTKSSYVGVHPDGDPDQYVPIKTQQVGVSATPQSKLKIDEIQKQKKNKRRESLFSEIRMGNPHRFSFGTPPSTPEGMKWVPKKETPPPSPQVVKARPKQDIQQKKKAAPPVTNPTRVVSVPNSPVPQTNTTTKKKQARTTNIARSNTTTTLFPTNQTQNQNQPANNRRVTRTQTGTLPGKIKRFS